MSHPPIRSEDKRSEEDRKAIDEWLAKGNKVKVCPPNEQTDPDKITYTYKVGSRGRKKAEPND